MTTSPDVPDKPAGMGLETQYSAIQVEPVSCPVCDTELYRKRFSLHLGDMVACESCGTNYVTPRMPSHILQEKLQVWAEQDVVDEGRLRVGFEPASLEYYRRFLHWAQPFVRTEKRRLLDIGCGTGAFLTVARDQGWQVRGVEVGIASSQYARSALNLDVLPGSIHDVLLTPQGFDFVAAIEVIEHLENPPQLVERIQELLVPGGLLLITTPNFDSLYRRLFGKRWWVVNCEDEHIVLFTMDTLGALLEARGFEIVLRRIQGIDILGLIREVRKGNTANTQVETPHDALHGYYEGRATKARVKLLLRKLGVLRLSRSVMRGLTLLFSWRWSPLYGFGEQLVIVARKKTSQ